MVSDCLVLGGGIAGAGAAALLARDGHAVSLIERETGPHHKVCGEFLSVEAQADLQRIGIDAMALDAVPIDRVRLIGKGREVESALPFRAVGLSRKVLDEALLDLAARRGAHIERGVRIQEVSGQDVRTSAGERSASRILLATGKHDVRGAKRTMPGENERYVGFKMHFRADAISRHVLSGFIELVVFDGGYAGIQLVSPDTMNLCLIVSRERLAEAGDYEALIASLMQDSALARRLEDAEPLFEKPLAISSLPYGYVHKPDGQPPALYRLGDQAAMTASLTGDGMAIALRSAVIANQSIASGAPPALFQRRVSSAVSAQVRRAMALQRLAEKPRILALGMPVLCRWPRLLAAAARMTRLPA